MKLYTLRFFPYNVKDVGGSCLCTVKASEIPKRGHLVYLGNDHLLNDATVYLVKRVVRCYSGDKRDYKEDGDQLSSIEIEVVSTSVGS